MYQYQEGFPISCFMHHEPYHLSSLPLSLDMIYARLPSLPIPIQKSAQRWTIPIQNGLCSFKVSQLNPPTGTKLFIATAIIVGKITLTATITIY